MKIDEVGQLEEESDERVHVSYEGVLSLLHWCASVSIERMRKERWRRRRRGTEKGRRGGRSRG